MKSANRLPSNSGAEDPTMTEYEQMHLITELLKGYDATFRAQIYEPLTVKTNFYVQMLSEIDQTAMDYEMTIFFSSGLTSY